MTSPFTYNSDLIGGGLMVRESRLVASLMLDAVDNTAWHHAIMVENCLQKNRPATAKRMAQAIRKRLERLDPDFWAVLREGDDELAAQVSFCAAMARNLLLVEFLETVVADAVTTQAESLPHYLWDEFLAERAYRDPAIAGWQPSSVQKMGQVVSRMLVDIGVLNSARSRKLMPLILRPELVALLEKHRYERLHRCLLALR
ncbi:DUF1819 domain-containing protein [Vreelandella rituensis]|uniref:DUF1819 family protein n=1 Tax=Vreelandella rituensis TaxID=2282306 RepID=A0A368TU19_9GAMM|nr:DUF1819 family protein [Halomonas rituensis]RCV88289.1 DUF1819 family protein [Halomonas rituensis]